MPIKEIFFTIGLGILIGVIVLFIEYGFFNSFYNSGAVEKFFYEDKRGLEKDKLKIEEIYKNILGRESDLEGLGFYLSRIYQYGWTMQAVREDVASSLESKSNIFGIYEKYVCDRVISENELNNYVFALKIGHQTIVDIEKEVADSIEACNKN